MDKGPKALVTRELEALQGRRFQVAADSLRVSAPRGRQQRNEWLDGYNARTASRQAVSSTALHHSTRVPEPA